MLQVHQKETVTTKTGESLNCRCLNTFNKNYSSNNNFPGLFKDFPLKYSFPLLLKPSFYKSMTFPEPIRTLYFGALYVL